ncbi:hypothetical protein ID854_04795 [Xenorhabdus sp. M]|uniref:Uncharacterized protein n=1 Tax=Xenorhabdus szentirmaii TaxID=290112 RepID=A0AAW3YRR0_9GAMM|nr:hypothetical protein [Xenorhabdus sp. M]MBD2799789.1 hypothetical protein [Xenorhabdus sp. M]
MNNKREKILRVKTAILSANDCSSLADIIDSDESAFSGIRMLFSTNASGAELQVPESHQHIMRGIFSKSRLLAYSDAIRNEMETGTSVICFKQRALFDTNLLSDLPKYFLGSDITTKEKIKETLDIIEKVYGGGFDYCFPMLENLRQFTCDNNPYPVIKVSAAIYLDHKLRNTIHYQSANNIFEPYFEQAENAWLNFRSSNEVWKLLDIRDLIYAVLLKTYHICLSRSSITIENALNELVAFCLDKLGVMPLKELYFAWKIVIGFSIGYFTPVFNETSLKKTKKDTISRIGALAWDLFIFRFTETLLTEEKGNNFYVPNVTTLDQGLLETVASCPVKAMISFPEFKYVETVFEDELQFQLCLDSSMSAKQKSLILDSKRNIRGDRKLRHNITSSIYELEKLIKGLK